MVEILGKLFGSLARVKIMRLFLLNPEQFFEMKDIALRSKISKNAVKRELNALSGIDFVKKRTFLKEVINKKTKKSKSKRVPGWILDPGFSYMDQVKNLLIDAEFLKKEDLVNRFKKIGKIKLFIISGIFTRDEESRVDFLLVVDKVKKSALDHIIKSMESEIGKELSYAVFDTEEFLYRLKMYDKLVRDILDFPHEKIVDTGQFARATVESSRNVLG
jgi:hypothetical protein